MLLTVSLVIIIDVDVGLTEDADLIRQLEALRQNILRSGGEDLFWDTLRKMLPLSDMCQRLTLRSWGWYFPPDSVDPTSIAPRIFFVLIGTVRLTEPSPPCPTCNGPTVFADDAQRAFGWRYRCAGWTR